MMAMLLGTLPLVAHPQECDTQNCGVDATTQILVDSTIVEERVGRVIYWVKITPGDSAGTTAFRIEWSQVSIRIARPRRAEYDSVNYTYARVLQRWSDGDVEPRDTSLYIRFDDTTMVKLNGDRIVPLRIGRTQVHVKYRDRSTTIPIRVTKQSGRLRIKDVLESF